MEVGPITLHDNLSPLTPRSSHAVLAVLALGYRDSCTHGLPYAQTCPLLRYYICVVMHNPITLYRVLHTIVSCS